MTERPRKTKCGPFKLPADQETLLEMAERLRAEIPEDPAEAVTARARRRVNLWLRQAAIHLTMAQEDMQALGEPWPEDLQQAHAVIRRQLKEREAKDER